jgi:signal transduction histidine kinase
VTVFSVAAGIVTHAVWLGLTVMYWLRRWPARTTRILVAGAAMMSFALLGTVVIASGDGYEELGEAPLLIGMFAVILWHGQRRQVAVAELGRAGQREREFVRNASHQLRTPITVAQGHAELIRQACCDSRAGSDAEIILGELARLSMISSRLLFMTCAEDPRFLVRKPIPLGSLIKTVTARWSATAVRRWIVNVESKVMILADEDHLGLALDALIENALKATGKEDLVAIESRVDGEFAIIEISDSGPGIPEAELERIFEPFARVRASSGPDKPGTGLGLSITRAIVEGHEGAIVARSRPGAGMTFEIRLPRFNPSRLGRLNRFGSAWAT